MTDQRLNADDAWQWLGGADNVTATLVALLVIGGLVRSVWRRTVGHRRALRSAVNSLAINVNEDYVRSLFGAPTYGQVVDGEGGLGWVAPYGNIGVTFRSGAVTTFTFTVTDDTFYFDPRIVSLGNFRGYIGARTFESAAVASEPDKQILSIGARRYSFAESYYFGNPGHYLYFTLAHSDSSVVGNFAVHPTFTSGEVVSDSLDPRSAPSENEQAVLRYVRSRSRPNTLTVSTNESMDTSAVDGDVLRMLPRADGIWLGLERWVSRLMHWRLRRKLARSSGLAA